MTLVALTSVKGAPGVTTTVLAMAAVWPPSRRLVVVEADPEGGVLAARLGLRVEPGLVTLAAALRRGGTDVAAHAQQLGAGVRVIVAPPAAEQTRAALVAGGDRLRQVLAALPDDVLADCGRLGADPPVTALIRPGTATTLVAIRPRLEDVWLLRERLPGLRRAGIEPQVILTGDGPYPVPEVSAALDVPVVGVLPGDRRTAAALGDAARSPSSRSPLLRGARQLAADLVADTRAVTEPAP